MDVSEPERKTNHVSNGILATINCREAKSYAKKRYFP